MDIVNTEKAKPAAKIAAARFRAIMVASSADFLSFDDIRQAEGKTVAELTDGEIHQAAIDAGLELSR